MSEPDVHTLTGVYAADALDDAERAAFERHLRECAACRAEVAELTETASRLASAVATPAPSGLRARVFAEVSHVRQLSPLPEVIAIDDRRTRRWYRQPVAAAAALLLVTSGGLGAVALDQHQRAERASRIAAIATDPDRIRVSVPVSTGGRGTIIAADGSAYFRTSDLTVLPDDRAYQLWVLRGDRARSAGVLGRGGELDALVDDMRPTDALGLTVEPADGSSSPTGELVLRAEMA